MSFHYNLDDSLMLLPIAFYLFGIIFSLAQYILEAIGLYKISKNTGLKNSWLSFIPVANQYLIGKLADRYNQQSGKKSSFAILLPVLAIAPSIVYLIIFAGIIICSLVSPMLLYSLESLSSFAIMGILPMLGLLFLLGIASLIMRIFALYLVYQDFEPSRAIPYTILTVFNLEFIPLILIRNNVPVGMAGKCSPSQPKFK